MHPTVSSGGGVWFFSLRRVCFTRYPLRPLPRSRSSPEHHRTASIHLTAQQPEVDPLRPPPSPFLSPLPLHKAQLLHTAATTCTETNGRQLQAIPIRHRIYLSIPNSLLAP